MYVATIFLSKKKLKKKKKFRERIKCCIYINCQQKYFLPGDVSMYLIPNLTATDFPAENYIKYVHKYIILYMFKNILYYIIYKNILEQHLSTLRCRCP